MSRFVQFGLAALLASSAIAAPAAKRDVVTVYVTAAAPAPTAKAAPAPAVKVPAAAAPAVKDVKFPKAPGNKAGIPYNNGELTNLFAGTKVSWGYDWVSSRQGLCPSMEFVPMLHDLTSTFTSVWQSEASAAIASGSKYLMGFNEPDLTDTGAGGSNISPADAAAGWKTYMQPFAGKAKLVSPGVTNGAAPMGLAWLKEFMAACTGCTVDAIAVHWYDQATNVAYFKQYLEQAHADFPNKPIWLSEYGAYGSDEQVNTFMQEVQPWLEAQPWIQRYAYFKADEGKLINGGALSTYGATYAHI